MADLTSLGKYEIRRELGRGAMGVVYEAYDPMIKRIVALKTIREDQLAGDDSATVIARFTREAQAAGRLTHPNIVSIYDFGETEGIWYIAMEFVQGRQLKDYFETNERFGTPDIVRIMSQILDALGYSHKQGVVHRDIKPANIVVLPDGNVKVADFGIAHVETSNMTHAGAVLGTPAYMSPEQILGLPVDGRSDLFSAGVILYQFLTGERPFTGTSTTTMAKVLEQDPLPPSRFNVQVPAAMDEVIKRALAKRPEERYQSAEEFAAAIRAAVERRVAGAAVPAAALDPTIIAGAPEPTLLVSQPVAPPPATQTMTATGTRPLPGGDAPMPRSSSFGAAAVPPPVPPVPPAAPAGLPEAGKKSSAGVVVAVVGVALLLGAGAAGWYAMNGGGLFGTSQSASAPPPAVAGEAVKPKAVAQSAAPAAAATAPAAPAAPAPTVAKIEPGKLLISAVGIADSSDPAYKSDPALQQANLRADSKGQLVEKALGLMLDSGSLATNYDALRDKLMSKSATYVTAVVSESAPRTGKDGLVTISTQAVVDVKSLQKSLNDMSRDERIKFIRASGDPRISVRIVARDADQPGGPAGPSPIAENVLKERIKSFGFRTWSEGEAAGDTARQPDFTIDGEVQIKKLSMKLQASGLTVTKYALNSWTIRAIDRSTGEEIVHGTALPTGLGSWASEGEALKAIGAMVADAFNREFFLEHLSFTGQGVVLKVDGMPAPGGDDALQHELEGLPGVITATPRAGTPRVYDLSVGGSGPLSDRVQATVLKPLNAKFGQPCFTLGAVAGEQVSVNFDKKCGDGSVISKLETNPPAGLYGSPPSRWRSIIKNPELLRKLST